MVSQMLEGDPSNTFRYPEGRELFFVLMFGTNVFPCVECNKVEHALVNKLKLLIINKHWYNV